MPKSPQIIYIVFGAKKIEILIYFVCFGKICPEGRTKVTMSIIIPHGNMEFRKVHPLVYIR